MAISDAQFSAWLLSDNSARCVLVEMDYQYESAGVPATGTRYFSDKVYFDGAGTHAYVDCINLIPQFTRSLGGNQLGTYSSSLGTLELDNADASQDSILDLAIDGSEIRFKLGDVTWPPADFRFIFSALSLKAVAPSFDRISVQLKDTGVLLNKSLGGGVVVGGSGPDAGQLRPLNFGMVRQVQCKVLDPVNLIYVHSDTGVGLVAASGSYAETVRDRGIPVVFTDNSDGTVTLAASPAGTITATVMYCSPSAGNDLRCISDAMSALIGVRSGLTALGLYYGPGPTYSVRPGSGVAAWLLAGGEDYQIGISISGAQNVISLLGDLTDSGLCFWAIRRDGKFTFGRLRPDYTAILGVTAAHTITLDNIDDGSFQIDQMPPLYYKYQATMSRNWSIQTDLASSLTPDQRAALTRLGLYVVQNEGATSSYADAPELYNKTLVQSAQIDTLLSGSDDVADAALLSLWMDVRLSMSLPWITIVSATVGIEFYDVELGDLVTVKIPRYGYDAGVDFQVISVNIKLPAKIELKLIRRDVQGPYALRSTRVGAGSFLTLTSINAQYAATTLLLHFEGANGGTVFTDSSSNVYAMVSS